MTKKKKKTQSNGMNAPSYEDVYDHSKQQEHDEAWAVIFKKLDEAEKKDNKDE